MGKRFRRGDELQAADLVSRLSCLDSAQRLPGLLPFDDKRCGRRRPCSRSPDETPATRPVLPDRLRPATLLAWSNHSLGTWLALADLEELRQAEPVQVESLEAFLAAEGVALEQLLDEQEAFAREHFPGYPARPDDLRWLPDSTGTVAVRSSWRCG